MSMTEKIRILLVKRGNLSEAELARRLETTPQNLNLREIAAALNCDYVSGFRMKDTGELV